jgi:hypothetical protein
MNFLQWLMSSICPELSGFEAPGTRLSHLHYSSGLDCLSQQRLYFRKAIGAVFRQKALITQAFLLAELRLN